jgi:hypothetical protein
VQKSEQSRKMQSDRLRDIRDDNPTEMEPVHLFASTIRICQFLPEKLHSQT